MDTVEFELADTYVSRPFFTYGKSDWFVYGYYYDDQGISEA